MTLYRRGEDWWFHFWYEGRHIQRGAGTTNRRKARDEEAKYRADLLRGKASGVPKNSPTFAEFADPYLAYSKANKLSYGVEFYYVNRTLVPFFGKRPLDRINPFELERFKQKRLKDGLKKSSINREIGLLKSMLKTAVEWELTDKNAAKDAKLFKLDEPLSYRVLSYEEEFRLLASCDQSELRYRAPHLKSIILIALYTGLRRSEILRLRWTDIDFDQNVLIVRKSKTTSGRGRRVGLNSLLRQTLLSSFEEERGDWVFPSPNRFQKPNEAERHIGDVKNAFRRAVRLSGIEPITFHQLRHTFCSRLADAGVPMPVIQDLAGHASITMTRRYTHPSEQLKQKAVEMLLQGQTVVLAATKSATEVFDSIQSQIGETASRSRSIT
jgi:integrase